MAVAAPSLGRRLDSAEAKVRRADQHLRALRRSFQRFRDRNPYAVGGESCDLALGAKGLFLVDAGRALAPRTIVQPQMLVSEIDSYVTLTPRFGAPALRWGTMIGDVVHNLASALDNLVEELARANPYPPEPLSKPDIELHERRRATQGFPYCEQRSDWKSQTDRYLFFVDPGMYPLLEETQPFYGFETTGKPVEQHPLWLLRALWNRDKHRAVNPASGGAGLREVTSWLPDLFGQQRLKTDIIASFPPQLLERTTRVGVIRTHTPRPIRIPTKVDLRVHCQFDLSLLFGCGSPAEGETVLDRLGDSRNAVVAVLETFR